MRTVAAGLACLAVLGIAGYFFFMRSDAQSCAARMPRIVAFGDSLVTGYGAPTGADAFSVLGERIGVPIENAGVSGDTSAQALARIEDVVARNPDIVIILVGGNDALQRVPVAETERNLAAIIKRMKEAGAKPILVGVLGGYGSDPFAPMFSRLSERYDVPLVPNVLSGLIGSRSYMSDAIHPNAAGYARIAELIEPTLEATCASS